MGRPHQVIDTLNFVRGGSTAFTSADGSFKGVDGKSYNADVYRDAIASLWKVLRTDPQNHIYDDHQGRAPNPLMGNYVDSTNLWANNTRIWIDLEHV